MATLKEIENIEKTLTRGYYLSESADEYNKLQEIDFLTKQTIINILLKDRYNELLNLDASTDEITDDITDDITDEIKIINNILNK